MSAVHGEFWTHVCAWELGKLQWGEPWQQFQPPAPATGGWRWRRTRRRRRQYGWLLLRVFSKKGRTSIFAHPFLARCIGLVLGSVGDVLALLFIVWPVELAEPSAAA